MCCIVGNYTGTPAWQTSIPTKIPQTSKIAPETPRNYKRETTREKLVAGGRQTNRKNTTNKQKKIEKITETETEERNM